MTSSHQLYQWFLVLACFAVVSFLHSLHLHHRSGPTATTTILQDALQASKLRRVIGEDSSNPGTTTGTIPPYHVVFSTSCEPQQHWESYVLFFHAWKVGQRGTVTRIASGCSAKDEEELKTFHAQYIQTLNPSFFLHLTPDFSRSKEYIRFGKARYKYMNKPYGLLHWLQRTFSNDTTSSDQDGIVILMDPDMILLRPIVHDYTNQEVIFVEDHPIKRRVEHGFPMAQQDGYLTNQWMELNASYVTNGGNIRHIAWGDGPKHYNTGPPYLATVKDMMAIAQLWADYAPRVYEIHPKLFAEMFGYIYATTQLRLPHTLIQSLVVSTTETPNREGWNYIDTALPEDQVCLSPSHPGRFTPTNDITSSTKLPVALHYCKRYLLHTWFFSKYRLKKHYISCEAPILQLPPIDLVRYNYTYSLQPPPNRHHGGVWDPPISNFTVHRAKREAFMVCQLIRAVNEAAIHFKKTACSNPNWNTNYTFFNDPND